MKKSLSSFFIILALGLLNTSSLTAGSSLTPFSGEKSLLSEAPAADAAGDVGAEASAPSSGSGLSPLAVAGIAAAGTAVVAGTAAVGTTVVTGVAGLSWVGKLLWNYYSRRVAVIKELKPSFHDRVAYEKAYNEFNKLNEDFIMAVRTEVAANPQGTLANALRNSGYLEEKDSVYGMGERTWDLKKEAFSPHSQKFADDLADLAEQVLSPEEKENLEKIPSRKAIPAFLKDEKGRNEKAQALMDVESKREAYKTKEVPEGLRWKDGFFRKLGDVTGISLNKKAEDKRRVEMYNREMEVPEIKSSEEILKKTVWLKTQDHPFYAPRPKSPPKTGEEGSRSKEMKLKVE